MGRNGRGGGPRVCVNITFVDGEEALHSEVPIICPPQDGASFRQCFPCVQEQYDMCYSKCVAQETNQVVAERAQACFFPCTDANLRNRCSL